MATAQRFLKNFANERFAVEGEVLSIYVVQGEETPQQSSAEGRLYSQSLDELERIGASALVERSIGKIHFRLGKNITVPRISVTSPQPHWPVPSIVMHTMTDGTVRFEQIGKIPL